MKAMAKKKSTSENIVNRVFSSIVKGLDSDETHDKENPTAKDVLGAFATWGGKSKDEIVQVLCREIGVATAAVLKEPIDQILENRKLQITMELVPKKDETPKKINKKRTMKKKAKPPSR